MAESLIPPELTQTRVRKRRPWLRGYKPPRKLRVTREGWIFILVTVGVGAAAVNTGNNLLFLVLGLLLSLIVISGLMSEASLRKILVERLIPARIHARMPSLIEVSLKNRKRLLPSFSIELEDLLDGWSTDKRCYFLKVAPLSKQTAAYRTVIPRRGPLKFTGYRVATRFPFAIFEKWREIELISEVIVYPELVKIPPASLSHRQRGGDLGQQRPGAGDEIHGLRELRPGDDSRTIHWKTSARRGKLIVRENEQEESKHLCIYLDNTRGDHIAQGEPDPLVEQAISIAASLVMERAAAGQGVQLATRGELGPRLSPGSSPDRLLRFLALLDTVAPTSPPPFPRLPRGDTILIAETGRTGGFDGAVIALPRRAEDLEAPR